MQIELMIWTGREFNFHFYCNFSPSTSLEAVGAPTAGQGTIPAPRQWVDSDDEAGDCIVDWSSNVAADILQTLSDGEKKRQEIINGKSFAASSFGHFL